MLEPPARPTATELDALTELRKASLRATHDYLSMLFVAPNQRGKGLGYKLVNHTMARCGVRRTDVNGQHSQALGFYLRQGFRIAIRDPLAPSGKPYPILHLKHDGNKKRVSR
ncbi:MAG: GNAT family N-acetyltransferase [Bacteroides cellulosilyticus]|nr:GNAT family N-acetyltransferase [Bacteroides cellulosilyticus]